MLTIVIISLRVAGSARIFGHRARWCVHHRDDPEASDADSASENAPLTTTRTSAFTNSLFSACTPWRGECLNPDTSRKRTNTPHEAQPMRGSRRAVEVNTFIGFSIDLTPFVHLSAMETNLSDVYSQQYKRGILEESLCTYNNVLCPSLML